MSLIEMDNCPRMRDTLRAEDLNTEACVKLAGTVLKLAARDYIHTRRALDAAPGNRDALAHFKICVGFYRSDFFAALSCGVAEPESVMRELDRIARGGKR